MNILEKSVLNAPNTAGVYLMKNSSNEVIYVGKAKNIRKRLASYLKHGEKRYQIRFLLNKLSSIEFITTSNEKEALILEDNLIKKYRPRYNIQLKDDKRYLCLMLDLNHEYPKFELTRKPVREKNVLLWGPYPSAKVIRGIIETVQKLFQLRRCSNKSFLLKKKPCIYYNMQQCAAPCCRLISKEEYMRFINGAVELLNGNTKKVVPLLKKLMLQASENEQFEKAAFYRDIINNKIGLFETMGVVSHKLNNVDILGSFSFGEKLNICLLFMRHGQVLHKKEFTVTLSLSPEETISQFVLEYYKVGVVAPEKILTEIKLPDVTTLEALLKSRFNKTVKIIAAKTEEERRLVKTASLNAANFVKTSSDVLQKLKKLFSLDKLPERIECFDVAHMMGKQPVCAMTVMVDGEVSKSDYRLFNFNEESYDDYKTLYQSLKRRFNHHEWRPPEILLIDGGKGQLSVAKKVLDELKINNVFLVAMTKDETPSLFVWGRKNPILLNKNDDAFKLLSLLREEAHRFANYQLRKRLKIKA